MEKGISAWSSGDVPHESTSNSLMGKTYAKLILGYLRDAKINAVSKEPIYIVELGAGHGRLAFQILSHLKSLSKTDTDLPPFVYVLSDIIPENLDFFDAHPYFKEYLEEGVLDTCLFDALDSETLALRHSGKTIRKGEAKSGIIAIANYFFDSIPSDLFRIKAGTFSPCAVSIRSKADPSVSTNEEILKGIEIDIEESEPEIHFFKERVFNSMLSDYSGVLKDTYLFFPTLGIRCIERLRALSDSRLFLLTTDKGYSSLADLEGTAVPDPSIHGSFSFSVNFHALHNYCRRTGGRVYAPSFDNYHLELSCLLFAGDGNATGGMDTAFKSSVEDFGPTDFNILKKASYRLAAALSMEEILSLIRLSAYDPGYFREIYPRVNELSKRISKNDRKRLAASLLKVWEMYFPLGEEFDLAFESAGLMYALGYFEKALVFFALSEAENGLRPDVFYNRVLCHYQLRQDDKFLEVLKEAKGYFPDYKNFEALSKLDLNAE